MFKGKKRVIGNQVDLWANFVIPEIKDDVENKKYERKPFVSPFYGTNVKDECVAPINNFDVTKRYDNFREEKLLNENEAKQKNGTMYHEFDIISNSNDSLEEEMKEVLKFDSDKIVDAIEEKLEESHKEETSFQDVESEQIPYFEIDEIEDKDELVEETISPVYENYVKPSTSFLNVQGTVIDSNNEWVKNKIDTLNNILVQFKINGTVQRYTVGPSVSRFEIELNEGVQVNKIRAMSDDIQMRLSVTDLRMEVPIPGKNAVGIEIPNDSRSEVRFGALASDPEFENSSPLSVALGLDIDGKKVFLDIEKMPHGLVAGATGSGKSVCVNTIITSLIMKNSPSDLRLLLVDPKMVELVAYNNLPHLVTPVITDPKLACKGLKWAVEEMERRYRLLADNGCRNIEAFNKKAKESFIIKKMPYIVIIVDELADLMMVAGSDVEDAIMRITQKARAAGIHLLVATQRPSVDVIKGSIKLNIPSRIAFSVFTFTDSNTILGQGGAERLLGKGDMLIIENGKPVRRVQGAYLSDQEIDNICDFIRSQGEPNYLFDKDKLANSDSSDIGQGDDLFQPVAYFVVRTKTASMSRIQREFNIGFPRANSLIELLEKAGVVGPNLGPRAREVLMSEEQLNKVFNK